MPRYRRSDLLSLTAGECGELTIALHALCSTPALAGADPLLVRMVADHLSDGAKRGGALIGIVEKPKAKAH